MFQVTRVVGRYEGSPNVDPDQLNQLVGQVAHFDVAVLRSPQVHLHDVDEQQDYEHYL